MVLSLVSCDPGSFKLTCPTLVQYSQEDRDAVADFIEQDPDRKEVKKFISDYYRLREACRSFK